MLSPRNTMHMMVMSMQSRYARNDLKRWVSSFRAVPWVNWLCPKLRLLTSDTSQGLPVIMKLHRKYDLFSCSLEKTLVKIGGWIMHITGDGGSRGGGDMPEHYFLQRLLLVVTAEKGRSLAVFVRGLDALLIYLSSCIYIIQVVCPCISRSQHRTFYIVSSLLQMNKC